jgi:hypothetical protein
MVTMPVLSCAITSFAFRQFDRAGILNHENHPFYNTLQPQGLSEARLAEGLSFYFIVVTIRHGGKLRLGGGGVHHNYKKTKSHSLI